MSLDKAIKYGKEKRKSYRGAKMDEVEDGMCEYKDYRVVAQDDNDFCSWGERREDDSR